MLRMVSPSSEKSYPSESMMTTKPATKPATMATHSSTLETQQQSTDSTSTKVGIKASARGADYRALEDELSSPPPYLVQEDSSFNNPLQATAQGNHHNSASQASTDSSLSITNQEQVGNDKATHQSDMQDLPAKTSLPVRPHVQQDSTNITAPTSTSAPQSVVVNGIKYVPETVPVIIIVPASSESAPTKSLKRVGNLPTFTAGSLPHQGQSSLGTGEPPSGTLAESSSRPDDHAAVRAEGQLNHTNSTSAIGGDAAAAVPTAATATMGAPVAPTAATAAIDTTAATAASNAATQATAQNTGIDLTNDPSVRVFCWYRGKVAEFYVHSYILSLLLGSNIVSRLSQGTVSLYSVKPSQFEFLLYWLARPEQLHRLPEQLEDLPEHEIAELYELGARFNQIWLTAATLEAMKQLKTWHSIIETFGTVYLRTTPTSELRECFKGTLRKKLEAEVPWREADYQSQLASRAKNGEVFAKDFVATFIKFFDEYYDKFGSHAVPGPMEVPVPPARGDRCLQGPRHSTVTRDYAAGTVPATDINERLRLENVYRRNYERNAAQAYDGEQDSVAGLEMRDRSEHWDSVMSTAQRLDDVIQQGPPDWSDVGASSDRMEVASASAVANDGWTTTEQDRDQEQDLAGSWDNSGPTQTPQYVTDDGWVTGNIQLVAPSAQPARTTRFTAGTPRQSPRAAPSPSSTADDARTINTPTNPILITSTMTARRPPGYAPVPPYIPSASGSNLPPMAMPNYVAGAGFIQQAHVGNGLMHPTAPGPYGLAGRTMIASRNSDMMCSIYFQAGDMITNVVPTMDIHGHVSLYGASVLQGICRSRAGTFPANYVRSVGGAPTVRELGSPFTPSAFARTTAVAAPAPPPGSTKGKENARDDNWRVAVKQATTDGNWGATRSEGGSLRPALKHAYVSEDNADDDWNAGAANGAARTPRGAANDTWNNNNGNTGWGASNNGWNTGNAGSGTRNDNWTSQNTGWGAGNDTWTAPNAGWDDENNNWGSGGDGWVDQAQGDSWDAERDGDNNGGWGPSAPRTPGW